MKSRLTGLTKKNCEKRALQFFFSLGVSLRFITRWGVPVLLLLVFAECSNTRFLAEDETLYTYTWYRAKGLDKVRLKPLKMYEMYSAGNVKTNSASIILPRTELTIYNYWNNDKDSGLVHYVREKLGRPPVLLKDADPDFRIKVMEQRLTDMGHFDSNVSYDLNYHGKNQKKVSARYTVNFKSAYTFNTLTYIPKHTPMDTLINGALAGSFIQQGDDYWVDVLSQERERLAGVLKNKGYYYFNSNLLLFHADTTVGNKQVDLALVLKDNAPERAFTPYFLKDIQVQVAPVNPAEGKQQTTESTRVKGIHYTSFGSPYVPKRVVAGVSLSPDSLYNLTDHLNTLRYLQGMGTFRSVELSYSQVDSSSNALVANLRLTPLKPITTKLEVNFATKSNDFMGPAAIASIGHNNIFRGGEKLVLQLDGGFEWQKSAKRQEYQLGFNSYEIGSQLKLTFPRFLLPFKVHNESPRYVPKTSFSLGYRTQKRVRYYSMNLSQIKYDYLWKTTPKREYKLEPLAIDYLHLTETSEEFEDFLLQYPQVAQSFAEQFILGSTFSYTYTNNAGKYNAHQVYYNGLVDVAGNTLNALYTMLGEKEPDSSEPSKIWGVPFAQYAKLTNDFRYYHSFSKNKQLAARLLAGVGVPYGNASVLPYVKQFFAGGSQDIRAFYARTIGPGSYRSADVSDTYFLDQSGEIKLMANLEYRFPITYRLNGAVFTDAGNVWLINDDPTRPGGKFGWNSFLNDVAIGSGFGIRADITYFIIRLDAAVPVRKPYDVEGGRWIFNNSSFFGDFILSLAVGYPF